MTPAPHIRAKEIFLQAVERPAAERKAFVAQACTGDATLRREVESLLSFHDDTRTTRLIQHARVRTDGTGRSLPHHMVERVAWRLQVVAAAEAISVVALWGVVNIIQGEFRDEFVQASQWLPPLTVLSASVAMFWLARRDLALHTLVRAGLAYEVAVSAALALSQYAGAFQNVTADAMNGDRIGLSYVAVWTLFFTVLIPARPREALVALVASGATVPLVYWQQVSAGLAPPLGFVPFTSLFVWPYALGIVAAYIAARVVHQLGIEVRQAHELGGYRLEALLGRGGMGEVWRASHHTLARRAAIKVIRQDALGPDPVRASAAVARFEAEAQVIASLQSPHTVELYDFGTTDEGTVFYVMELLDGVDLDALVRQAGPQPPARVVHILRQVCASLAEAHHRGLVHRDIKPANITLGRRGLEYDVAKVLDFGLATAFAGHGLGSGSVGGAVIGTPDYMAPETTRPGSAIDGRADIYALGCVAFWLLTGRVVFPSHSMAALLESHRTAQPAAPSAIASLPIPDALDRLVLECLNKTPGGRPQSAVVLAEQLARLTHVLPWSAADAAACWK